MKSSHWETDLACYETNHVSDFLDLLSFAQNVQRKTVTSYANKFLSWNI